LIIRDFRREDIDGVIECARESFVEEFEKEGFDPDVWRKVVRRRFSASGRILFGFFKLFGKEPIKFFVADMNGKVVGTTMVTKRRNIAYIETVMVRPDFRRKGIATELMKTAIHYARKRRFACVILQVSHTNNSAKELYHKLGFKKFDDTVYLTANLDSLPSLERVEGIQVRDFQKWDKDAVYELIRSSRDPNWFKTYNFQKSDLKTSLWNRIARMSTERKVVAVKDGKIVGYASLSYTTGKEAGRIRNIDVSPDMGAEGIEEELIRTGLNYVKPSGTKVVLVTVPLTKEGLIKKLADIGFRKWLIIEGMVLKMIFSSVVYSVLNPSRNLFNVFL